MGFAHITLSGPNGLSVTDYLIQKLIILFTPSPGSTSKLSRFDLLFSLILCSNCFIICGPWEPGKKNTTACAHPSNNNQVYLTDKLAGYCTIQIHVHYITYEIEEYY